MGQRSDQRIDLRLKAIGNDIEARRLLLTLPLPLGQRVHGKERHTISGLKREAANMMENGSETGRDEM